MEYTIDRYFPDETQSGGDSGVASFEEKRPLYLAGSRRFLSHYREKIKQEHQSGAGGAEVVAIITSMSDTLILKLFNSILSDTSQSGEIPEITLVAVGGYGRTELNPFSDIDIMFLFLHDRQGIIEIGLPIQLESAAGHRRNHVTNHHVVVGIIVNE